MKLCSRSNTLHQCPFFWFQVSKLDFEKMNEFAEAAMIVRNPTNAAEIRAQRKRLLEK